MKSQNRSLWLDGAGLHIDAQKPAGGLGRHQQRRACGRVVEELERRIFLSGAGD